MNGSWIATLTLAAAVAVPASAKVMYEDVGLTVSLPPEAAQWSPYSQPGGLPQLPVAQAPLPGLDVPAAPAPQSAAARMTSVFQALSVLPNLSAASDGSAKSAGDGLAAALSGEKNIGSGEAAAPVDGSGASYATQEQVAQAKAVIDRVIAEVGKVIVGQEEMKRIILMSWIMRQHVLLEGIPGVGKTEAIKAFADAVQGRFSRIQGTSDKQPSDIIGVEVVEIDPKTGQKHFEVKEGPILKGDLVLVDEINRMTGKTQSAVLEPMAEYRTTIGNHVYDSSTGYFKHFSLQATQNPVEQDGTNRLPEAQSDRFWAKVIIPQPNEEEMMEITQRNDTRRQPRAAKVATLEELDAVGQVAEHVRLDDALRRYAIQIVMAPSRMPQVKGDVDYTVYVRAGIRLCEAARLLAVLDGRNYVTPGDIRTLAPLVLRHRIALKPTAGNLDKTAQENIEDLIAKVLNTVPLPQGYQEPAAAAK